MNPELSTYINALRVLAAMEVFVGHLCFWNTRCGILHQLPWLGSDGVVIFFVLSGYVIAYTSETKDRAVRSYFINRCARIYSVAFPALLLTVALEWIGVRFMPGSYNTVVDHYQFAKIAMYLPLWLTFSAEFWNLNEPILSNAPFWSLCFEVWFYIAFALFLFMRGAPRIIAIAAVALLVGPKICIFFPLWGLGVLAYHWQRTVTLSPLAGRAVLLLSIGAYLGLKVAGLDWMAIDGINAALDDWPRSHLQMAWQFPGYFLIALCVAASLIGMRFAALRQVARFAYPVGILASFTFTIYLTHTPLLKFFVAIIDPTNSMLWPAVLSLGCVVLVGLATERRIGPWRVAFARLVASADKLSGRARAVVRSF